MNKATSWKDAEDNNDHHMRFRMGRMSEGAAITAWYRGTNLILILEQKEKVIDRIHLLLCRGKLPRTLKEGEFSS